MDYNWKWDDVALYSYTPIGCANSLAQKLNSYLPHHCTSIYDACACIGGNTQGFVRQGFHVFASEIDEGRSKFLEHNMKQSNCPFGFLPGSCFAHLATVKADVVFIDAPWAQGQDYKSIPKFTLDHLVFASTTSQKQTIFDAFKLIKQNKNVKFVVLKVPNKFYEDNFRDNYKPYWFSFRNHKYCVFSTEVL